MNIHVIGLHDSPRDNLYEILCTSMNNVFVIPRSALFQGKQVTLIEQGRLLKKNIDVVWSDTNVAVVKDGLKEGDILTLTPVGSVPARTQVNAVIDGQITPRKHTKDQRSKITEDNPDRKLRKTIERSTRQQSSGACPFSI